MLPIATGGDVCRVLKRSSDGWTLPPVAVVSVLFSQFSDFISVMQQFTIECRLYSISTGCRCNGRGHAHVQDRTAAGDSCSCENVSRPGLRGCEPSKFRSNSRVWQFHATKYGMNTCVVPSRGFGRCCRFLRVPAVDPGRNRSIGTGHPDSVAEPFLHVGNVIVRCQDTSTARVPGGKATCGRPERGTCPQSW